MKLLRFFLPALFTNFFRLGFGGDSTSASSSSTANYSSAVDQRQVLAEGAIGATAGGTVSLSSIDSRNLSDNRDLSTNLMVNDSSNRQVTSSDNSNRSVNNSGNTTTTTNFLDPGALRAMETAVMANRGVTQDALNFARISQDNSLQTAQGLTDKSLSLVSSSNATLGQGFASLLQVGKSMFDTNVNAVNNLGAATAQAYRDATADKSGGLDNKTILLLGAAAIAAFAFSARKG
jgi:hypothetical protein